jgi:sodium transport system permease protein
MGSMYPAIDLAAGEKERGTLETLLTTPTRRMEILLGKFGVVMLTGLFSAIVSIAGMSLGVSLIDTASPLYETIVTILEVKTILLLLSLLLPLTVFFAALSLSLSLYARSFKEAQNIITPMMFVVIVPAFIGVMPGMELNSVTALIPILNVSLTTKAIIAAKTTPLLMAQVYGSLLVLAAFSLFICGKIFEREEVIFRGV